MKTITNYFQVKDVEYFKTIVKSLNVELLQKGDRFALKVDNTDEERERFQDNENEILKPDYIKLHECLVNGEMLVYYESFGRMACCYIHSNKHTDQRCRLIAGTNTTFQDDLYMFSSPGAISRKFAKKIEFPEIANFK